MFENKVEKDKYFGRDEFQNSIVVNCKDDIVGKVMNVKIKDFNLNLEDEIISKTYIKEL